MSNPTWSPPTMPLDANIASVTKNWFSRIGGDSFEYTKCDKRTRTDGWVFEDLMGSKFFYILGVLAELFTASKTEEVFGAETKINVGALIEVFTISRVKLVAGAAAILNRGPKYILFPGAPHNWWTPAEDEANHQKTEMIGSLRSHIGGMQQAVRNEEFQVSMMKVQIASQTSTVVKLTADWSKWEARMDSADIKGGTADCTVSGTELLDVGSFTQISKGASIIDGPTAAFDGGGGKIDLGGTVDINGKLFAS